MASDPREVLAANMRAGARLSQKVGPARTMRMLERADKNLVGRIRESLSGPGAGSFTHEQLKSTLVQVRATLRSVALPGLRDAVSTTADEAADVAGQGTVDYLQAADDAFSGVGTQPLALDEAAVLDAAGEGASGSVMRRLVGEGGEKGAGILQRYGMNVVGNFEEELQTMLLSRMSLDGVKARLIERSPFLQGAPASWAVRIARTETMGALNRANWEASREADDQLGDVIKILGASFDARTGPDSYNVAGQVRYPDEPFEYVTYNGGRELFQHPPDRPNDRGFVVTHRLSWPIPPALLPIPDGQVVAMYARARQQFHGRPTMSTVDGIDYGGGK